MISTNEILLFLVGIILSCFFSGSEAVVVSLSLERMKQLIEKGGRRGKLVEFLQGKSSEILNTILVGNNIVNVFIPTLAATIMQRLFESNILAISTFFSTSFILIFGEIIPKTFARTHVEKLIIPVLFILKIFYFLLWPIVKPLTAIISFLLGKNARINGRVVTAGDIEFMVNQAEEDNSMDSKQIDLLNSILEFPTIKVRDIMRPRNKIQGIKSDATFEEVLEIIRDVAHSRYPVYKEDLDDVSGFLHVKDLALVKPEDRDNFYLENFIKEPFYVFESMKIQAVFDHMNRNKVHLSLVKDESGLLVGIVTLEDIMEEIFGEILDEHDNEEDDLPGADHELTAEGIVVSGTISLRDLYNEHDIKIPLNDNFSTLTGFVLEMLENNFPKQGQVILWENFSFELTEVNGSEIERILIKVLKHEEEDANLDENSIGAK